MRSSALAARLRNGGAGDEAVDQAPAQAVLAATAARLAAAIEARDRGALGIEHFHFAVDPQAAVAVVPDRADRRGVERRLADLVHRRVLAASEIGIAAFIHVSVPLVHGVLEVLER